MSLYFWTQAIPQNGQTALQLAPQSNIQVLPISGMTSQGQIILQQPQQTQVFQMADGQTLFYQPLPIENTIQSTPTILNINGNLVQLATNASGTSAVSSTPQATTASIVTNGTANLAQTHNNSIVMVSYLKIGFSSIVFVEV